MKVHACSVVVYPRRRWTLERGTSNQLLRELEKIQRGPKTQRMRRRGRPCSTRPQGQDPLPPPSPFICMLGDYACSSFSHTASDRHTRSQNGDALANPLPRDLRGDPRSCTLSMRVRRGCSSDCTIIHERGAGAAIISSACLDAGTRLRLWRDNSSCGRAVHVRSWQRRCARSGIASATTACVATCSTARLEGTRLRLWRDSSSCGRAVHVWSEHRRSGCTRAPGCARVRCERSAGLGCPSCSAQATHESAARLGRDRPGASHARGSASSQPSRRRRFRRATGRAQSHRRREGALWRFRGLHRGGAARGWER